MGLVFFIFCYDELMPIPGLCATVRFERKTVFVVDIEFECRALEGYFSRPALTQPPSTPVTVYDLFQDLDRLNRNAYWPLYRIACHFILFVNRGRWRKCESKACFGKFSRPLLATSMLMSYHCTMRPNHQFIDAGNLTNTPNLLLGTSNAP